MVGIAVREQMVHEPYFSMLIFIAALAAGCLGALTGLGGGVILIPLMVLVFKVDVHYAIGTSLVAVIATSSGAAAAYVREGYTNVRIAMLLEVATVGGALLGAYLAGLIEPRAIMAIFSLVLFWSAWSTMREPKHAHEAATSDALALRLRLPGEYPTAKGMQAYAVRNAAPALGVMFGAGALSALVGIGAGIVKVVAMDRLMRLPFKVSTTTSNFMLGVTAAASAGVYFHRGQIDPGLTMPVVLGTLLGALMGTRILTRAKSKTLRIVFACLVLVSGVQLMRKALMGGAG